MSRISWYYNPKTLQLVQCTKATAPDGFVRVPNGAHAVSGRVFWRFKEDGSAELSCGNNDPWTPAKACTIDPWRDVLRDRYEGDHLWLPATNKPKKVYMP